MKINTSSLPESVRSSQGPSQSILPQQIDVKTKSQVPFTQKIPPLAKVQASKREKNRKNKTVTKIEVALVKNEDGSKAFSVASKKSSVVMSDKYLNPMLSKGSNE